mgnify:CR=1 FL=1
MVYCGATRTSAAISLILFFIFRITRVAPEIVSPNQGCPHNVELSLFFYSFLFRVFFLVRPTHWFARWCLPRRTSIIQKDCALGLTLPNSIRPIVRSAFVTLDVSLAQSPGTTGGRWLGRPCHAVSPECGGTDVARFNRAASERLRNGLVVHRSNVS